MATCSACEAPLLWAESETTGRPMPLNPKPVELPPAPTALPGFEPEPWKAPKGTFAVVKGKAHAYTADDLRLKRDAYTSHFSTCPKADQFRGGSR
jgi:hypothetical protein